MAVSPTTAEKNNDSAIYIPLRHHDRDGSISTTANADAVALFTARMEHRGVLADGAHINAAAAACREQLKSYQQKLETMGRRPVKVGQNASTNAIKTYLFSDLGLPVLKRTDTGKASVDAEAILGLSDYCRKQAPEQLFYLEAITAYRGLNKLYKTYLMGLADKISPISGAIHTQFFPLGAETGCFTSAQPNCQNLPAGELFGVNVRDFLIARLVFSCNSIPKNIGDRSEAFYRRLVIIPFAPPKAPLQRDLHLKEKLAGEAAGILNWALAGLGRLAHNGFCFSESAASRAALNRYRVAGSSVLSFVEDCCVVAEDR